MRNRASTLLALLLAALLVAGCVTPRDRYLAANRALLGAQKTATAAIASGYLDDKPALRKSIVFGLNEAVAANKEAQAVLATGDDLNLTFWTDRIMAGVARATATLNGSKP